jgi:hypothetical protein
MNDSTFLLAHILLFSVFIVAGGLALLLPDDKYRWLLAHVLSPGALGRTGNGLQRRAAGLALALMGLYAVVRDVLGIYNRAPEAGGHSSRGPATAANVDWLPFLLGLLVVGIGFFVAFNPDPVMRWCQRELFPDREISRGTLITWRAALRVTGALLVYSSLGLFRLWLKH